MQENKKIALANFLGINKGLVVSGESYDDNIFTIFEDEETKEYLVLTDDEADEYEDEWMEDYIYNCVLIEVPEHLHSYFKVEEYKDELKFDGRGATLSSYDGVEHVERVDGDEYFIYRVN